MHVALNLQRMATTTTSWKIIVTVNVTMPSAFSMYLHDTMRSEMHKILLSANSFSPRIATHELGLTNNAFGSPQKN